VVGHTSELGTILAKEIGPDADRIEVDERGDGVVVVRGMLDEIWTRDRILTVLRGHGACLIEDCLGVNPEWGEEAQPKQTEFGREKAARAMTWADFGLID
jgi:hypothetical protein